jgi:hypothetical protein
MADGMTGRRRREMRGTVLEVVCDAHPAPQILIRHRFPSATPNRFDAAAIPTDSANRIASTLNSSVYFRYRTGPLFPISISWLMSATDGLRQLHLHLLEEVSPVKPRTQGV